jgi:hypothetical protein
MQLMDPAHQMIRGLVAIGAFGLVYGVVTLALGVPEARGLLGRVLRR